MAQPTPYVRAFSFTDYTANNPSTPQPGVRLDAEFNAIATATDSIRANLALIQRDDGALHNGIVGPDSLSADFVDEFNAIATTAIQHAAIGTIVVDQVALSAILALKASLAGTETFTGLKTFSLAPPIVVGSAVTAASYGVWKPSDFGAGKPGVFLRKKAAATAWSMEIDDGAGGSGSLDVVGVFTINGGVPLVAADVAGITTSVRRARNLALTRR